MANKVADSKMEMAVLSWKVIRENCFSDANFVMGVPDGIASASRSGILRVCNFPRKRIRAIRDERK